MRALRLDSGREGESGGEKEEEMKGPAANIGLPSSVAKAPVERQAFPL